ncbi:MAG: glycosyltransferase family 4 protein [Bacteroidota bacterium]
MFNGENPLFLGESMKRPDTIKIAHLTSAHPYTDIRIFHKQCVSLSKQGYAVYLVATNCASQVLNGVNVVGVQRKGKGRFSRMFNTTRDVYRKALELDADIYHFHDPELLPFGLKLARRGKIVIYDAHEDLPKQIMDKHWIPKFLRGFISNIFRLYEGYVAKRIAGVVSVNQPICDRFSKHNSHVVQIANYPLMDELVTMGRATTIPGQVCYVGGLSPTRGIREMVNAMEATDARLVLAGNFVPPGFEEELRKLKGWVRVDFRGYIDRNEIIHILASSELGLVTLHPTRSYVEALPIKLFEYMSAGIPVIASDFPLWREIIEDAKCGICVNPMDPSAIAKGIQLILSDKEVAREMGENGQKAFREKYNWSIEEQKLFTFYTKLLN